MADATMVEKAAALLREAELARTPCDPVRELIGPTDVDAAYAVQQINVRARLSAGARIAGRKIGLTNKVVQAQLGVEQPDFGALFADRSVDDDGDVELSSLIAPRIEAEVAFVLERDLDLEQVTTADILRATAFVIPSIEIVDSRVREWDISIADTISDNASGSHYVLGTTPRRLAKVDVRAVTMTLVTGETEVSAGRGASCLGNPVNAVVWLANALAARGDHLRAGDVVMSGALGPMARVLEPGRYEAIITGLGNVRVGFV